MLADELGGKRMNFATGSTRRPLKTVCGSLRMAGGVDRVLREVLGEEALQRLADERRYRRDVY